MENQRERSVNACEGVGAIAHTIDARGRDLAARVARHSAESGYGIGVADDKPRRTRKPAGSRANDGARKGQPRPRRGEGIRAGSGGRTPSGEKRPSRKPTAQNGTGQQGTGRKSAAPRTARASGAGTTRSARSGQARTSQARSDQSRSGQPRTRDGQPRTRDGQPRKRRPQDARGRAAAGTRTDRDDRRSRTGRQGARGTAATKRPTKQTKPLTAKEREEATRRSRRIKLIVFVVAAVVLAIAAILLVTRYALSKIENHTAPVSPVEQYAPVECSADMLSTSVDRLGSQAGQPLQFTTSITNTGERPCYFDAADLRLHITSGDQIIFDTATCQAGIGSKTLLLDTELTTSQPLQWNGLNTGADCSASSAAQPGTYVGRVFLGGDELLESGIVFDLAAAPPPEPEPTDDAEDTGDTDDTGDGGEPADGTPDEGTDAPPTDEGVQAPTEVQSGEPEDTE